MLPLLQAIKEVWEQRTLILAFTVAFLVALTLRQHETIVALRQTPTVEFRDRDVERLVVVRGPERVVEKIVTVQGPERIVEKVVNNNVVERIVSREATTTTTETTTDRAPETTSSEKTSETDKIATPPQGTLENQPYRYIGLALDPFDRGIPQRARAGVTLWRHLDAGVSWDPRLSPRAGGLQLEVSFRF